MAGRAGVEQSGAGTDHKPSPLTDDVLHTLTGAMSLLRRCRVNAALTIQLFSQLFHFINMWLFNRLVTDPESGLCSHYWGAILRQQLGHVEAWAEKQGLELAADCHLSRIVQVSGAGLVAAWPPASLTPPGRLGTSPGSSHALWMRQWCTRLPGPLSQGTAIW